MKKSVVRRVLKYIKPYKGLLALAILSAIISVSLTLYIPVLTGNAIDNIIDKGPEQILVNILKRRSA